MSRIDVSEIDLGDSATVDAVDRAYGCRVCRALLRALAPGERRLCEACGGELEREAKRALRRPRESETIPVGRWCRDDLLWYCQAREQLGRGGWGPAGYSTPLAVAIARAAPGPSRMVIALREDSTAVVEREARLVRVEIIERTLDTVLREDAAWHRLLQEVWMVRRGRVECGWREWWSDLGRKCATAAQLRQWHDSPAVLAGWARREFAKAVVSYDYHRGEGP